MKSSRARQKIKHWLNIHQRERAIEIGRKLIEKEARKYRIALKDIKDPELLKAAAEYGLSKVDDLMAGIGYGKYSARSVLAKVLPGSNLQPGEEHQGMASAVKRAFGIGQLRAHRARHRRSAGLSRTMLQPDSRRGDRRLRDARQGRGRAQQNLFQRAKPDV